METSRRKLGILLANGGLVAVLGIWQRRRDNINVLPVHRAVLKRLESSKSIMGLDTHVCLLDLHTYRERVLPARKQFMDDADPQPLIALLGNVISLLPHLAGSNRDLWPREVYEEDIEILAGRLFYSPDGAPGSGPASKDSLEHFVNSNVLPEIVQALCVARNRGINPIQNMGRSALVPYLYERSKWIEALFTFSQAVHGGSLEIPIGESTELFTPDEVKKFQQELAKVSPPKDPERLKEYENLSKLLELSMDDPFSALGLAIL